MKYKHLLALSLIGFALLSSCGSEMIIEYENYTIKAPSTMIKIKEGQYANNDYVLVISWTSSISPSSYYFATDYIKDILISNNIISYIEPYTIHIESDGWLITLMDYHFNMLLIRIKDLIM